MPINVSNSTIDVITRGLIKYRLITHASANTVGAELIRVNHLAVDYGQGVDTNEFYSYNRRPFERKVKRAALDGAIRFYLEQIDGYDLADIMPAVLLVKRLAEKNMARIEQTTGYAVDTSDEALDLPSFGDIPDTDEGREAVMIRSRAEREEANRARLAERMAAIAAERAANPEASSDEDYDDEDDFDDDDVDGDE